MKASGIEKTTCFYDQGEYYPVKVQKGKKNGLIIKVQETLQTIHIEVSNKDLKGTYTISPLGGDKLGPFPLEIKKRGEAILTATPEGFATNTRWIFATSEQEVQKFLEQERENLAL